jgi:DNA-directed RNA polymerase specialized sigma24 family protein
VLVVTHHDAATMPGPPSGRAKTSSPSPAVDGSRADEDRLLEAAYRAEFAVEPAEVDAVQIVGGVTRKNGDLRAYAVADLADRIAEHGLLRRSDDTARMAALHFVERRLVAANKPAQYDGSGVFAGFLRRVLHNLLLDWLRSPAGRAELRRASHEPGGVFDRASTADDAPSLHDEAPGERDLMGDPELLPSEAMAARKRLALHHLVALRTLRGSLPPGRSVVLRLSLWPDFPFESEDLQSFLRFAHCHESATSQGESRGCDSGKRCTVPTDPWKAAWLAELAEAQVAEPSGLARRTIAMLTRIGNDKPLSKREGAVCERISKGRMQLVAALRRSGIRNANADLSPADVSVEVEPRRSFAHR